MEVRGRPLLGLVVALAGACGVVLAADPDNLTARREAGESFQCLVGGLGFGPAADPAGCAFAIDPRLEGACSANLGHVPGGGCFCGRHTGLLACPPRAGGPHP